LFQWVRLGLKARGPRAAARRWPSAATGEGERGTKREGGGTEILYWKNPDE